MKTKILKAVYRENYIHFLLRRTWKNLKYVCNRMMNAVEDNRMSRKVQEILKLSNLTSVLDPVDV